MSELGLPLFSLHGSFLPSSKQKREDVTAGETVDVSRRQKKTDNPGTQKQTHKDLLWHVNTLNIVII